jgi:hypothetical protein
MYSKCFLFLYWAANPVKEVNVFSGDSKVHHFYPQLALPYFCWIHSTVGSVLEGLGKIS